MASGGSCGYSVAGSIPAFAERTVVALNTCEELLDHFVVFVATHDALEVFAACLGVWKCGTLEHAIEHRVRSAGRA